MEDINLNELGLAIFGPSTPSIKRTAKYIDYIQSDEWAKKRLQAVERDGNRCRLCYRPAPPPMHVHHRTYKRLGDELAEDLTTLCQQCHDVFHSFGGLW